MSVNKVILLGNVGKNPEVRYLDTGVAVAQFSLATTERGYTDREGKQIPDRTEWHDIVAWRGLAETIEKYVKSGDKLYVEGKLRKRRYEGQDGVTREKVEIYMDNMEMLTPKNTGRPLPPDLGAPAAAPDHSAGSIQPSATQSGTGKVDFSNDGEDEIPFWS